MSELTKDEIWFIDVYFKRRGFYGSYDIIHVTLEMQRLSFGRTKEVIHSLVKKRVLSLSPDGRSVKFTDYGIELYRATAMAQAEWESQPIVKVSNIEHDQILIRAGETFRANRIIREMLSRVQRELCILDPYIGPDLFDPIEDINPRVAARIITSDRAMKSTLTTYKSFKNQYPSIELRQVGYEKIHDRYILWDQTHGFHFAHSIKDLGKKDTQLNLIQDPSQQLNLFEQRWTEGTIIV